MGIKISELPSGSANINAIVPATNAAGNLTEKVTLGDIANLKQDWEVASFSGPEGSTQFTPQKGRKYYLPNTDSMLDPWDVVDPQPGLNGDWYFFWNQSDQTVRVGGVDVPKDQIVARYCEQPGPGAGTWRSLVVTGPFATGSGVNSIVPVNGNNVSSGQYSSVLGGQNNDTNNKNNSHIIGSNITADAADTTFVENLKTIGSLTLGKGMNPAVKSLAYDATVATDASEADVFDLTLTGDATLANPTNPVNGKTIRWRIQQDATGGRTVTLGNKFVVPSSATSPLPFSTAANKMDILAATYHAGRDKWDVVAFVMGY